MTIDNHPKNDAIKTSAKQLQAEKSFTRKPASVRKREIIQAARKLYEVQGLTATSVQDIAKEAGVTRSLFYHYFEDKSELTQAVLETYLDEYVESLKEWNRNRTIGDIDAGLASFVQCYHQSVEENEWFLRAFSMRENASLYLAFLDKIADRIASYICNTTVVDYQTFHEMKIDYVYETFYMMIYGLIGYLRHNPDATDECVMHLVAQTLHMERGRDTVSKSVIEQFLKKGEKLVPTSDFESFS